MRVHQGVRLPVGLRHDRRIADQPAAIAVTRGGELANTLLTGQRDVRSGCFQQYRAATKSLI
jgi:hypothetical protein